MLVLHRLFFAVCWAFAAIVMLVFAAAFVTWIVALAWVLWDFWAGVLQ